ncbi:MAG: subunit of tubulin prefoldin [Bogoriella megaspora]|nr:MAG: subunit of tubulin prefoldin [Bogoriella megaspora]
MASTTNPQGQSGTSNPFSLSPKPSQPVNTNSPVDLSTLSTQQLSSIKKQLDDELTHLSTSYQNLRAAQTKFRDCLRSIQKTFPASEKPKSSLHVTNDTEPKPQKSLLVPLTPSLYLPAKLSSVRTVVVDVGTGFYVEKSPEDATSFYEGKVEELESSLKDLEKVVQGKGRSVAMVEDVIRGKVLSEQGSGSGSGTGGEGK